MAKFTTYFDNALNSTARNDIGAGRFEPALGSDGYLNIDAAYKIAQEANMQIRQASRWSDAAHGRKAVEDITLATHPALKGFLQGGYDGTVDEITTAVRFAFLLYDQQGDVDWLTWVLTADDRSTYLYNYQFAVYADDGPQASTSALLATLQLRINVDLPKAQVYSMRRSTVADFQVDICGIETVIEGVPAA